MTKMPNFTLISALLLGYHIALITCNDLTFEYEEINAFLTNNVESNDPWVNLKEARKHFAETESSMDQKQKFAWKQFVELQAIVESCTPESSEIIESNLSAIGHDLHDAQQVRVISIIATLARARAKYCLKIYAGQSETLKAAMPQSEYQLAESLARAAGHECSSNGLRLLPLNQKSGSFKQILRRIEAGSCTGKAVIRAGNLSTERTYASITGVYTFRRDERVADAKSIGELVKDMTESCQKHVKNFERIANLASFDAELLGDEPNERDFGFSTTRAAVPICKSFLRLRSTGLVADIIRQLRRGGIQADYNARKKQLWETIGKFRHDPVPPPPPKLEEDSDEPSVAQEE